MTDLHRLMSDLADRMPAAPTPVENAVAAAHRVRRRRAAAATVLAGLVVVGFVLLTYFATVNRAEPEPTQPNPHPIHTVRIPADLGGHGDPLFDRLTPSPQAAQQARTLLPTVWSALERSRTAGLTSAADLRQAVIVAGIPADKADLRQENGQVAVGIPVGSNACLYGYVDTNEVDIQADGGSVDGGCMPAEKGH
ncbi:MAG: hypothetical protein ACJ73S_31815 [Mycobacteriales bacterium]